MSAAMARRSGWLVPVLLLSIGLAGPARADLSSEMTNMFNTMAIATPPSVFSTAMRGVISGGGLAVSNRITNTNIVSITPPSFSAGCGGIDLYAGSFSFINGAQFEAMLRGIASNATGYAFEVAMNAMCPTCMSTIETLARKINDISQHLSNSCQLAQGIVNEGASVLSVQDNNTASLANIAHGVAQDAVDGYTTLFGPAPINRTVAATPTVAAQQLQGNVTWRALVTQNASTWFNFGDLSLMQMLMNVGGTEIVGQMATDSVGDGTQNLNVQTIPGRPDLLDSLIDGGQVNILLCDGDTSADGCLSPSNSQMTLTGFSTMILTAFEGQGLQGGGIIDKVSVGGGTSLTASEQAVLGLMPDHLGGLLVRVASKSPDAAKALIESTSGQLALLLADALLRDMLRAAQSSVLASQDKRAKDVSKLIQQSWDQVHARVVARQVKYGSLPEIVQMFQGLMGVSEPLPRGLGASLSAVGPVP